MVLTLNKDEIAEALVEYLDKRGVSTDAGHIYLTHYGDNKWTATVTDVVLPPKDGPYR